MITTEKPLPKQSSKISGWISIHRQIQDHWIFKNPLYLKAWITMLLGVNFEDSKVVIDGELLECKKGESLRSVNSWMLIFGNKWTRQKVRTFFNLLEKDSMIAIKGLRKTTSLTICNYGTYQSCQPTDNQQKTNRKPTDNQQITTSNNYNKENKENKKHVAVDLEFENAWKMYERKGTKTKALNYWKMLTEKDKNEISAKIKDYVASTPDLQFRKNFEGWINPKNKLWRNIIFIAGQKQRTEGWEL